MEIQLIGNLNAIEWESFILQTLVAMLLSGAIVGLILRFFLDRRMEKHHFTRALKEEGFLAYYQKLRKELYDIKPA